MRELTVGTTWPSLVSRSSSPVRAPIVRAPTRAPSTITFSTVPFGRLTFATLVSNLRFPSRNTLYSASPLGIRPFKLAPASCASMFVDVSEPPEACVATIEMPIIESARTISPIANRVELLVMRGRFTVVLSRPKVFFISFSQSILRLRSYSSAITTVRAYSRKIHSTSGVASAFMDADIESSHLRPLRGCELSPPRLSQVTTEIDECLEPLSAVTVSASRE